MTFIFLFFQYLKLSINTIERRLKNMSEELEVLIQIDLFDDLKLPNRIKMGKSCLEW